MSIRMFKIVAVVEAISYLALVAAAIAKRAFDRPEFVPVIGPVHGIIFLVYLVVALAVREQAQWTPVETVVIVGAAMVPLGGIAVERRMT